MLIELRSLFDRDLNTLAREVSQYSSDESLWVTAPGIINPGGNLVLHLCGNLRHYIGFRLGGIDYTRDRPAEFSMRGHSKAELLHLIEVARQAVGKLGDLTATQLEEVYPEEVLGGPMTTGFFLLHLYGHMRYHTGQLNYHRRLVAG